MYELGAPLEGVTIEPGTSLLLSGPPLAGKAKVGYDLLANGIERDEGAIVVTNKHGAERLRRDHEWLFTADAPVGIVDCVTKQQGQSTITDTDRVQYASSPEDMTGVGIKFSELLEAFYTKRGSTRNRTLFVSVSTLLMYSDLQTVFRFLHVFTSRIENAEALGLFIIQSETHEARTMNTLSQLFDGVIEVDLEGELTTNFL